MKDPILFLLLLLVGIIFIALVNVLVVCIAKKPRKNSKNSFDERQKQSRSSAAYTAMLNMAIFMAICYIVDLTGVKWLPASTQMCMALVLGFTVFFVIVIFKDAFDRINSKMNFPLGIAMFILGLLAMLIIISDIIFFPSELSERQINAILFDIMWTFVGLSFIIKHIKDKRAVEEE